MSTRPTALVLEDSRSERDQLASLLNGLGLDVWPTDSPQRACEWIDRQRDYDLAVIDWDMTLSADSNGDTTSRRVLEALARDARETLTVVYARQLGREDINGDVLRAHPAALLHDKRHGEESLRQRLTKILSPRVGDLELDERYRIYVCHVPSGRRFKHRIAFKLMTNYPEPVMIPRDARGPWCGMGRFRKWLRDVGSTVSVVHLGQPSQRYRLVLEAEDHAPDH